jgi:hypothetical protein
MIALYSLPMLKYSTLGELEIHLSGEAGRGDGVPVLVDLEDHRREALAVPDQVRGVIRVHVVA